MKRKSKKEKENMQKDDCVNASLQEGLVQVPHFQFFRMLY